MASSGTTNHSVPAQSRGMCTEIGLRQPAYDADRRATDSWMTFTVEQDRNQLAGDELARRTEPHVQDRRIREDSAAAEVVEVREVAEAVDDQVLLVELHAAKHMRAARDHQTGAVA